MNSDGCRDVCVPVFDAPPDVYIEMAWFGVMLLTRCSIAARGKADGKADDDPYNFLRFGLCVVSSSSINVLTALAALWRGEKFFLPNSDIEKSPCSELRISATVATVGGIAISPDISQL